MANHIKNSTYVNSGKNWCVVHIKTSMLVVEKTGNMLYIRHHKIHFRSVLHSETLDAK